MMIKYAIKGITKSIIFTTLLVIQLIFAFYALYNTIDMKRNVSIESSKISKYFKDRKIYQLQSSTSEDIFDKDNFPKVNEVNLSKTFKTLNDLTESTITHQVLIPMLIKSFEGHEKFKYYPPESKINGENFFQAKNITLNESTLREFNVKLKKGRFFNEDESQIIYGNKNSLPIIVGSAYEKYFKLGDEIEYIRPDFGKVKAKIIGILEENQYIPVSMMAFDDKRYVDLNNSIITSYSQFENYKIMYSTMFGYNFIMYDKNIPDNKIIDINNEVKKIFYDNLGLKIDIKDQNRYVKAELDTFKSQENIVSVTALTIIIFISITLIISTINSISKRKKEFGVHIFCGGNLTKIAGIIYLEILLILLISFCIFSGVIFYQNGVINADNIKIVFLILMSISIITTIIPIVKILNLDINDLIKGAE